MAKPVLIGPRDPDRRRALLRRVLDGQIVIYAVQVYTFLGGEVADFYGQAEREMADDLIALGYRPRYREHTSTVLRTRWLHEDADSCEPMPMPAIESEADCTGRLRTEEEILGEVDRRLDEAYPDA